MNGKTPTKIALGDEHFAQFVNYEGEIAGCNILHKNKDGKDCNGFVPFTGYAWEREFNGAGIKIQSWKVESFSPLSLSPSIQCRSCGDHGFIRNGKWEVA